MFVFIVEVIPHFDLIKRVVISDIKDYEGTMSIFEVAGYEGTESLLAGCVP